MYLQLGKFNFGYNATEDKGRRQAPKTRIQHESDALNKTKRRKLQATTQDQFRNHALVAWMIRKHLDYVSKFHFSFRTERTELDNLVNRIFRWHGHPRNMDVMQRFGRDEFFRLFESEKVIAGDAGILKLPNLKLQAVESDEITKPSDIANVPEQYKDKINDSGLVLDNNRFPTGYCLCDRNDTGTSYVYNQVVTRDQLIFDGYWSRFKSQYRGISPLSTAINTVQDISEAFEFNLLKAKMHALFGIAITRKPMDASGDFGGAAGATAETEDATAQDDGSTFDINPRAINLLDLNEGEDVKTIESGTPSAEFVEGSYLFIQIAMLALDIPITCFDSRRSSFSARIADLNEYEVSCDSKRTKNRYVRQEYSDWVLAEIWNDPADPWGLREVANRSGFTRLRDIQEECHWIPSGSPWLDKYKQVMGDGLGISLGLDNAIDAARRRGSDVFQNIDKQAQVIRYAQAQGVPIQLVSTSNVNSEQLMEESNV